MMNRFTRVLSTLVGLAVLALAAFYVVRNPERDALDDAARRAAPGRFVRLSDGVTHYELAGPDTGRVVLLVHGFSVPYYIWDSTTAALTAAGHRVLRYDEYGRGWSDRPSVTYTADLYDRQIRELLDSLGIRARVDLAGVSMGGWVTATFAARHPERVRSLILVDPVAGKRSEELGVLGVPLVGRYVWQTTVVPHMAEGQLGDFLEPSRFPGWPDLYRPQMRYHGFGHALLSTQLALAGADMDSLYAVAAHTGVPVLLIWGAEDHTVPFALSAGVRRAIPQAEFHAVERSGHLPIIERASVADSLILEFLARHPR